MASNTATAVATTLIGAACGLVGGFALGTRRNEPSRSDIESAAPRQQAAPFEATAIESRLEEVQRGLAELRSLVAGQTSSSDRTPIVADSPASTASKPAAATPDQDRFKAIELELAAIRQTITEQVWVQSPPPYEQLVAASPIAVDEVDRFADFWRKSKLAATQSLVGKSYADVLAQFGVPRSIEPTRWRYFGSKGVGFYLKFVNGYVGDIEGPGGVAGSLLSAEQR